MATVVLAHLNHPLVAMATRLLRAEVWGSDKSALARVASIRVTDSAVQHEVLAAYSRLVLIGADGKRLHEELVPAGGVLRDASFNRLGVGELAKSLDAALGPDAHPAAASDSARHTLMDAWPKVSSNLSAAIDARQGATGQPRTGSRPPAEGRGDPHDRVARRVQDRAHDCDRIRE